MADRIVVAGGTGFLGTKLCERLARAGHTVVPISRHAGENPYALGEMIMWDPASGVLDTLDLAGADVVINLAGATIAQRWNDRVRREILESRLSSTRLIATTIAELDVKPRVFLNASAIGYYGDRGEEQLDETSVRGDGFLADVVEQWEAATQPARNAGIRTVLTRTGIVLSPDGGALPPMLRATKLGAGGALGSGKQWWPWISIDDEIGAMLHCIERDDIDGPVNLVAPNPERMKVVAKAVAKKLHRPALLPTPAFALKAVLGAGQAEELVLASARIAPTVLQNTGYRFEHPTIDDAIGALL
jgi:uncharacterized protein (TIGR01777 family)